MADGFPRRHPTLLTHFPGHYHAGTGEVRVGKTMFSDAVNEQ